MAIRFVAEIGQNHNGSLETAKQMVDELKDSGAWAIKTAKRNVELHKEEWDRPLYGYDNYYNHRKELELSKEEFKELKDYVEKAGFVFMSSFTDLDSLNFLKEIGCEWYKIASSRNQDYELLNQCKSLLNVIISDGMCEHWDRNNIIDICRVNDWNLILCTSSYPTQLNEIAGLDADYLYHGFSAHWTDLSVDYMLLGTMYPIVTEMYIERHITLDKTQKGTDHKLSLECHEVKGYLERMNRYAKILETPKQIFQEKEKALKN